MPSDLFPLTEASRHAGFAGNRLDRCAVRRDDAGWIAGQAAREDCRYVLFLGDSTLMHMEGERPLSPLFAAEEAGYLGVDIETAVFLGLDGERPRFAAVTVLDEEAIAACGPYAAVSLRGLAMQDRMSAHDLGLLAQGKSLASWHHRHRYCANCGAPTDRASGGWRRECPSCGAQHFPRTDPVVIMLVTDGERCLMGRQPHFQPGMYSALAGFLEPGETIEDAVRREVAEEAGIAVGAVGYYASQPWPFPANLMIGCFAEALSTTITLGDDELEDCRWFDREEAQDMLDGMHPDGLNAPRPLAMAHTLLERFLSAEV